MRFSVLVPVYNVEQYLEKCIDSILSQTYQDFELILVDDGSTDGSELICDRYANTYQDKVVVIHKSNQGLISARRVGIAYAKGDFCVFVDSDDYVKQTMLEILESYLKRDKQIDMLLYSFQYDNGGVIKQRKKQIFDDSQMWCEQEKKELYKKLICASDITSIWTKAIRTDILKEDPTDYSLYYSKNMAEDLLQSLYPITAARKVIYTTQALYYYRINSESISRSFYPETIRNKNTLHVYQKIMEYLPVWDINTNEIRNKLNAKWFNDTMYMMSNYYENASEKKDRQAVLAYDWNTLMPEQIVLDENLYINGMYKRLYELWKQGRKGSIGRYFWRKKCYQKLRKWKKLLF